MLLYMCKNEPVKCYGFTPGLARVTLHTFFIIETSRLFSRISNDWHVQSSLQVESKDSTTLKKKLQYVDGANTSEGITSCDAHYLSCLLNFLFIFPFFGTIDDGLGLASLHTRFRVLVTIITLGHLRKSSLP